MTDAIFSPFRAVGDITGEHPASFTLLYGKPVLMVPSSKTFHLYRGLELSQLRGGPVFENHVTAVSHCGKYRFASEGPRIHGFCHHKPLFTVYHSPFSRVKARLLLAMDEFLFSCGEDRKMVVFSSKTGEALASWLVAQNETVSAMIIPEGYTNKILVSTLEGNLHLYNFRTQECIFITSTASKNESHHNASSLASHNRFGVISCLTASRFKDIVAFGTGEGKVFIYNFGTDEVISSFQHQSGGVTAVAFRTDKDGYLCSATSLGEVAFWDLHKKCLDGIVSKHKQVRTRDDVVDDVHQLPVHSLIFFPIPHPLLVTLSEDNAMVQFRLDTIDGMALMVRERRGHFGHCTTAAFYDSKMLMTAGSDQTLRCTHLFSDRASWELSQGKLGKRSKQQQRDCSQLRLPPAVAMSASAARNYQWASIVTVHANSSTLCGWKFDQRALVSKIAPVKTGVHSCQCVAVSMCGNFAFVGYSSGNLCRVNLQDQSVFHFVLPSETAASNSSTRLSGKSVQVKANQNIFMIAHHGAVAGVHIGSLNQTVISYGAADGFIRVWDLLQAKLLRSVYVGFPMLKACAFHPEANLLAVGCGDHVIRLYDVTSNFVPIEGISLEEEDEEVEDDDATKIEMKKKNMNGSVSIAAARTFIGHRNTISAACFTPDTYRHLVSSSVDCMLFVWDVASGQCVGQYRVESPVTSIAFHPDALFMVTTHIGERGAFLWTNNLRYGFAPDVISQEELCMRGGGKQDSKTKSSQKIPMLHFIWSKAKEKEEEEQEGEGTATTAKNNKAKKVNQRKGVGNGGKIFGGDGSEDEEPGIDEGEEYFQAADDIGLLAKKRRAEQAKHLDAVTCHGMKLSGWSPSQLTTLISLDQIKERNQPILPPKKESAPFFLTTTRELKPTFIIKVAKESSGADASSASQFFHARGKLLLNMSSCLALLFQGEFSEALQTLLVLTPAEVDLELRRMTTGRIDDMLDEMNKKITAEKEVEQEEQEEIFINQKSKSKKVEKENAKQKKSKRLSLSAASIQRLFQQEDIEVQQSILLDLLSLRLLLHFILWLGEKNGGRSSAVDFAQFLLSDVLRIYAKVILSWAVVDAQLISSLMKFSNENVIISRGKNEDEREEEEEEEEQLKTLRESILTALDLSPKMQAVLLGWQEDEEHQGPKNTSTSKNQKTLEPLSLSQLLEEIQKRQKDLRHDVGGLTNYAECLVSTFSSAFA